MSATWSEKYARVAHELVIACLISLKLLEWHSGFFPPEEQKNEELSSERV